MMRCFVILLAILFSNTALAATPVSQQTANAYYQSCISRADERMSLSAQEGLCSCAAARMVTTMTLEDLVQMKPESGPGRAAYNKMLAEVYGPCMQFPIEDELHNECMRDSKIKQFALRDQGALCHCMAKKTGALMPDQAPGLMRNIIKHNPGISDPFKALLNNQTLREQAYNNIYSCLTAGN